MLHTGKHRKRISIVNRLCISKPVIRILCTPLAYKTQVIRRVKRIHSNKEHAQLAETVFLKRTETQQLLNPLTRVFRIN